MADTTPPAAPARSYDLTALSTRTLVLGVCASCVGLWSLLIAALTI